MPPLLPDQAVTMIAQIGRASMIADNAPLLGDDSLPSVEIGDEDAPDDDVVGGEDVDTATFKRLYSSLA